MASSQTSEHLLAHYQQFLTNALRQTEQDTLSQRLAIAGVVVELRMKGAALTEAMLPALAHLAAPVDAQRKPDIIFHLWDGAETGAWPPRPPFNPEEYRRYGQRAIAYNGSISLMHDSTEKR